MKRACAAHEGVVEQMVARKGHSLEVTGSNPVHATIVFSWFVLSAPGPHQSLRLTGSKHAEVFKVNKDVHPASRRVLLFQRLSSLFNSSSMLSLKFCIAIKLMIK